MFIIVVTNRWFGHKEFIVRVTVTNKSEKLDIRITDFQSEQTNMTGGPNPRALTP